MLSSAMDRLSHRLSHSFRVAESLAHPSAGANSRESILGELERARRGDSGPSNVASALPASSSSSSSALSSAFSFSSPNLSSLSPSSSFGGSSGRRARSSRSQSYATDKFESSTTSAAGLSARLAALSATHSSAVVVGSGNLDQLFSEPMTQHYDDQVALSEGATSSVKSVFPNIAARLCKLSRVRAKLLERDKPTQRPMRKMVTHLAGSSQEQQIASPDPQNARALFRQAVVDSSVGAPKLPALGSPVGNESITSVAASQSFATSGSHVRTGLCRNAEGGGDQDTARLPEVAPGRGPRLTLKLIRGEFRKFDTDGNQLLDAMEFKHFISSLHPNLKPARWAECKRRFARWDKDGSGFLDFEEFVSLYEDTFGPLPRNEHDVVPSDQDEDDGDLDRNDVPSRKNLQQLAMVLGGESGNLTHSILIGDISGVKHHLAAISTAKKVGRGDSAAHVGMGGIPFAVIALYVQQWPILKLLVECKALDEGLEASERQWLASKCDLEDNRALKVGINELYNNALERLETLISLSAACGSESSSSSRRESELDGLKDRLQRKAKQRTSAAKRAREQRVREKNAAAAESSVHRRRSIAKLSPVTQNGGTGWELHEQDRALFTAVLQKDVAAVSDALRHGASVGVEDNEKNQPLYFAICYGFVEIAELLLKNGADPLHVNLYRISLLHAAAVHEQIPAIHLLMRHDTWNLLRLPNTLGQRPIDAARTYYVKEYLYGYMLDSERNTSESTSSKGHVTRTRGGSRSGSEKFYSPHSTFQRKRFSSNRDHSRYLGYVVSQYVDAVQRDDFDFLRDEALEGADLDLPCAFGMTPLMHAIVHNRERIVALLVEQVEADLLAISALGNTPLHFAYQLTDSKCRKRIVAYLLAHGAKACLHMKNIDGFVPKECSHETVSKHFVTHRCNV